MIDLVRRGVPVIAIGMALMTTGVALFVAAFLTTTQRRLVLLYAGAFTGLYGLRLAIKTALFALLVERAAWLPYARSSLEYLVPVAAALLFQQYGGRWRLANQIACGIFIAIAVVAIPFELVTRSPGRMTPVIDAIVIPLMALLLINAVTIARRDAAHEMRVLVGGAVTFAVFVTWQHAVGGGLYIDAPLETIGFLIFVVAIVYVVVRVALHDQVQLLSVRGELAAARAIQGSILPRTPPRIEQLDIAALYAPATEVGGDFYDFVPIDDARAGFFIADVSGHGVPAALVASMLKIALATQQSHAADPAALLGALNRLFCGKLQRQFITAAYVCVDVAASTATVASAGHPPPLFVGDTIREIAASGPILGRFRDAAFTAVSLPLAANDAIVLYTDGVTEARSAAGEQFGEARLRAAVAASSAQEIIDRVRTSVASWSAAQDDDVALLVVRRDTIQGR